MSVLVHLLCKDVLFCKRGKSRSRVDTGSRAADWAPNTGILPHTLRLWLFVSPRRVPGSSSGLMDLCQPLACHSESHTHG